MSTSSAVIDFSGGTVGGIASVLVGQPLDTVKVKLQTFPTLYKGTFQCVTHTLKNEGLFTGLYRGTIPSLAANVAENSVLFCSYGVCQAGVAKASGQKVEELGAIHNASAGFCAAFFSSLVLCPTELIKCRMQTLGETSTVSPGSSPTRTKPRKVSSFDLTRQLVRQHGITGLFRGLSSTLLREMPGYFCFFGGYEATRMMFANQAGRAKDDIGFWKTVVAGGVGGVSFWTVVFPADVLKSRIQVSSESISIPTLFVKILRHEGIFALYNGLLPTLLRAFPATGALFVSFEYTKRVINEVIESETSTEIL